MPRKLLNLVKCVCLILWIKLSLHDVKRIQGITEDLLVVRLNAFNGAFNSYGEGVTLIPFLFIGIV